MLGRTNFFYGLNMEQVRVECYAGMQAEEQPRRFYVNGRKVEVTAIVKRWLTPEGRCFEVNGDDGSTWVLEYRRDGGTWCLPTMKGR